MKSISYHREPLYTALARARISESPHEFLRATTILSYSTIVGAVLIELGNFSCKLWVKPRGMRSLTFGEYKEFKL